MKHTRVYGIESRKIMRVLVVVAGILSIPLVMMQLSPEWDWGVFDFIVIGTLLTGAGVAFELLSARFPRYRWALGAAIAGLVLLSWAELAVGVVGTPFAGS